MAYDYEALYAQTPDALGAANADVVALFETLCPQRILDVGCGQGRDCLALARMGHHVHGVDLAPSGVAQMVAAADAQGLAVTGEVADITAYTPQDRFDAMVIDRTLHMLDDAPRVASLAHLLASLPSLKLVIILDEPSNIEQLKAVFPADDWRAEGFGTKGNIYRQGFVMHRL